MGIRFFCPNGHKLNVKSELAGKRGVCPHCGVKMLIPTAGISDAGNEIKLTETKSEINPEPSQIIKTAETQANASSNSSLLDDMSVVWYIQGADGERYGPATGPIINSWIEQRRISPKMLIWREGWPEWLEAKNVFPELLAIFDEKTSETGKSSATQVNAKKMAQEMPFAASTKPESLQKQRKKRKKHANLIIVFMFAAIAIALLIVLVVVLIVNRHRAQGPRAKQGVGAKVQESILQTSSVSAKRG